MRESVAVSVLKIGLMVCIAVLMGMLYWSSSLLEDDIKELRREVSRLQDDVDEVQSLTRNMAKKPSSLATKVMEVEETYPVSSISDDGASSTSGTIAGFFAPIGAAESPYPNLLSEDPFYSQTLPNMLGLDFVPWGVRHEATIGKPDHLHPLSNWASVSSWWGLCSVSVSQMQFGKFETMAPDMALRLEERFQEGKDVPEYWVFLRDGVYWQPLNPDHFGDDFSLDSHFLQRHEVTAHDFKFYWQAVMNPFVQEAGAAALRNYLGDIEEIEVVDDHTFVVRWKSHMVADNGGSVEKVKYVAKNLTGSLRPLARWVYQYLSDGSKILVDDSDPDTYMTNSVWAQNFSQHWARNVIVSCGPWVFDGMSDEQIAFVRNSDHYQPLAVLVEGLEVRFKESPDAIWQDFKAGKIDTYAIQPKQLVELEEFFASPEYREQYQEGLGINRLDYLSRSYSYVGWNQATPYFDSRAVRQAMTMAIDRERIIDQYLNHMGVPITGPFFVNSPSYNPAVAEWPYDPRRARSLLEQDGWYDSDGDGIIDKFVDGKRVPFRFNLTYYVKNPVTKANSEYIATALRGLGIDVNLSGVDIADLSSQFDEKSFDAIYLGWSLGTPPEEPKQLWHSSGAQEKGSSNAVGFANAEADDIIETLQYEYNMDRRRQLYHRFHQIVHREAPYTFLYTPKTTLLHRSYVRNVFIPAERQDLIPGANASSPDSSVWWLEKPQGMR